MAAQQLDIETEEWLSLGQAAERLNVHRSTLRRWADNGDIPVMLTPGGHRRFAASDIASFARERHGLRHTSGIEEMWASEALSQTRQELDVRRDQEWLSHFDEEARARHRTLGRQLMGLTLRYLSAQEEEELLLQQARQIGEEYAHIALQKAMPLTEALSASIFFRDTLIETTLHLPENRPVRAETSLRLVRRINTLLNTVHLAIAEVYDDSDSDSLPRA
ncbi:MAG: helix-turn-helix domain-containing protein [Candidatus Promineifilaceae bacterium]|nr:helix-turn-helix domain-containing protein [Candidatus Promineifilaceae bacterium]